MVKIHQRTWDLLTLNCLETVWPHFCNEWYHTYEWIAFWIMVLINCLLLLLLLKCGLFVWCLSMWHDLGYRPTIVRRPYLSCRFLGLGRDRKGLIPNKVANQDSNLHWKMRPHLVLDNILSRIVSSERYLWDTQKNKNK